MAGNKLAISFILPAIIIFCLPAYGGLNLPPGLTGEDYTVLLQQTKLPFTTLNNGAEAHLPRIIEIGKRNLIWLGVINNSRPFDHQLSFNSPETQNSCPIEQPCEYNPEVVLAQFKDLWSRIPKEMRETLEGQMAFTSDLPVPVSEYLKWGLQIDKVYQTAARWMLMKPYLEELTQRQTEDVRGYYYLSQLPKRQEKLATPATLNDTEKARIGEALLQLCMNSSTPRAACENTLQAEMQNGGDLNTIYDRYSSYGQANLEAHWQITPGNKRQDIVWNATSPMIAKIPFKDPGKAQILSFLVENVEDEWKWNDWQLRLDIQSGGGAMPFLEFEPGQLPHVLGIGGNKIVMDASSPLNEYGIRWAIRHEFGHVLGFPDCYVEFFDVSRSMMITYQLDVDDLMCSKRGRMKERLYQELKRVYYY